jgi:hypothetical protein
LAGAVQTNQALLLTFEAADAAAAFCFFSAAGKEKENNYELRIRLLFL